MTSNVEEEGLSKEKIKNLEDYLPDSGQMQEM